MNAVTENIDQAIEQIEEYLAGKAEVIEEQRVTPKRNRITVMLDLQHLKEYGYDTTRELVYGCNFPVKVGDLVECPPTPRKNSWTTGVVVALSGKQYKGRVKHVRKHREESK